jgi:hypothetical protein
VSAALRFVGSVVRLVSVNAKRLFEYRDICLNYVSMTWITLQSDLYSGPYAL